MIRLDFCNYDLLLRVSNCRMQIRITHFSMYTFLCMSTSQCYMQNIKALSLVLLCIVNATCKISKLWALCFLRFFFKFHYIIFVKSSDHCVRVNFTPIVMIWTILVEVYQTMLQCYNANAFFEKLCFQF